MCASDPGLPKTTTMEDISTRIMEDLDEDAPIEPRREETGSPSMMFGSTTSTFLEFKPEPMRITCLTIGSRGDVQPYIALCKGLQAEGHIARIATHGEYKDWVEGVSGSIIAKDCGLMTARYRVCECWWRSCGIDADVCGQWNVYRFFPQRGSAEGKSDESLLVAR
jgi:hypothetical protein